MAEADQILKVDAAGRVWTPRAQREAALDEFERSGLSATKFAAHIGVKYPTFAAWRQQRRRQGHAGAGTPGLTGRAPAALRWVEASVEGAVADRPGVLVVQLPGGARLEVADAAQARLAGQLLRALGEGGAGC
jgi:transposase-like protein